jgi:hypothetical protein
MKLRCDNCGRTYADENELACVFPDIPDLLVRIEPGGTTEDRLFTFQPVNCLGACALAPVMVIDEKYYGKVTPDQISGILSAQKIPYMLTGSLLVPILMHDADLARVADDEPPFGEA